MRICAMTVVAMLALAACPRSSPTADPTPSIPASMSDGSLIGHPVDEHRVVDGAWRDAFRGLEVDLPAGWVQSISTTDEVFISPTEDGLWDAGSRFAGACRARPFVTRIDVVRRWTDTEPWTGLILGCNVRGTERTGWTTIAGRDVAVLQMGGDGAVVDDPARSWFWAGRVSWVPWGRDWIRIASLGSPGSEYTEATAAIEAMIATVRDVPPHPYADAVHDLMRARIRRAPLDRWLTAESQRQMDVLGAYDFADPSYASCEIGGYSVGGAHPVDSRLVVHATVTGHRHDGPSCSRGEQIVLGPGIDVTGTARDPVVVRVDPIDGGHRGAGSSSSPEYPHLVGHEPDGTIALVPLTWVDRLNGVAFELPDGWVHTVNSFDDLFVAPARRDLKWFDSAFASSCDPTALSAHIQIRAVADVPHPRDQSVGFLGCVPDAPARMRRVEIGSTSAWVRDIAGAAAPSRGTPQRWWGARIVWVRAGDVWVRLTASGTRRSAFEEAFKGIEEIAASVRRVPVHPAVAALRNLMRARSRGEELRRWLTVDSKGAMAGTGAYSFGEGGPGDQYEIDSFDALALHLDGDVVAFHARVWGTASNGQRCAQIEQLVLGSGVDLDGVPRARLVLHANDVLRCATS